MTQSRGIELPLELVPAAVERRDRRAELHCRRGEQARQQTADDTREPVGVDHAERVVDVAERPHQREVVVGHVDQDCRDGADDHGAPAVDETGGRCDRHEADDDAVDAAEQRRLALGRVVAADPHEECHRGADVRVQHRRRRVEADVVRVAAVEAVPAEPEQAGADGDHRQVVRRVDLAVPCEARADHPRGDEAGDACGEMDDVAAREVEHAVVAEVAAAPDQEGVDGVDQRRPEDDEDDPRLEVHAAEHRTEHQQGRDRGEHELEVDERRLGERHVADQRDVPLFLEIVRAQDRARMPDEGREEGRVAAEDVHRLAERHVVAVQHPDDEDDGERDEGEHHAVDRPALLHHPAVEHDETRNAHETHERGGGQLPGVVRRIEPGRVFHPFPFRARPGDTCAPTRRLPRKRQKAPELPWEF